MINTVFKEGLFAGKTVLITGGGTGIGLRTARELAILGASVIIAGRTKEKLDKAVDVIKKENGDAIALICNIREEESIQQCIADAIQRNGTIDLLVNNAGGQFPSPAENISSKGWKAVIETNLSGNFFITREVFNQSMKKNGGSIVNVLANFWNGFPMLAHTGAARSGVDNLTKSLAVEWGRYGVRVNSVAPGIIHSGGLDKYPDEFKSFIFSYGKNNQANRLGTEAEVAAGIIFLLSPAASFITGETLKIDGAESLFSPVYPPAEHKNSQKFED